jgi:2-oxoglutarate/2-oxoacid ferredoxin oxidoreductase subunit beta
MVSVEDYKSDFENKWCPGCGNFGILEAMKDALVNLDLSPHEILIVSGIGQAAKTPEFLKCNMFHGLHGRALPVATGAKIANHELTILVNSGDGDCYGEGGNHFLSAIRRNIDLTLLVHNNQVYGLTKGQASPTSDRQMVTKAQPFGVMQEPFNPLMVAIALGAGFVARAFSGHGEHLSLLIQKGIRHKGFSLIDILQPCVSFNRLNTHKWYKDRVFELEKEGHDPSNFQEAMEKARMWGDRIPIGTFYISEKPSFTDRIKQLEKGTLLDRTYSSENLRELLSRSG